MRGSLESRPRPGEQDPGGDDPRQGHRQSDPEPRRLVTENQRVPSGRNVYGTESQPGWAYRSGAYRRRVTDQPGSNVSARTR